MELLLKRIAKKDNYTIGKLYIDGKYFCDTLEDKDRGLTKDMSLSEMQKTKVYGKTAIPTGKYQVVITYSNRFKKYMPLLLNTPGFAGVRLHAGNSEKDTEGCVLLGVNKVVGKVIQSRIYTNKLYSILNKACKREKVYITIQ